MKKFVCVSFVCLLVSGAFGAGGDLGIGTDPLTDGSADHPFLIEDFADFQVITEDSNYWVEYIYIELMCDLDLDPDLPGRIVYPHAPIARYFLGGGSYQEYEGVFEGNGHVIRNIQINGTTNLGLFGRIYETAFISNLALDGGSITGSKVTVGGFCGSNDGVITNCSANVSVTGSTETDFLVGGFVASNNGTIVNCYSTGDVVGGVFVGGFVGIHKTDMSRIQNCYSMGDVIGNDRVGGFVGYARSDHSNINCCYSTGNVTGNDYVGGFVGLHESWEPDIQNCYSTGNVTGKHYAGGFAGSTSTNYSNINYSYSTGRVSLTSGDDSGFGGFCGVGLCSATCLWDTQTSGIEYTGDDTSRGIGFSTAEMHNIETYIGANWGIQDLQTGIAGAWYMESGSYPELTSFGIDGTATVPTIVGLDEGQCRSSLTDAGFTVGDVYYVNSLSVGSGLAVCLSVHENGTVDTSNSIDIYISLGLCGDGSADNPWPVACAEDLEAINNNMSASYYMVKDINLPIGKSYPYAVIGGYPSAVFSGTFDGKRYTVRNLVIDGSDDLGLLRCIDAAGTVKNLNIDKCQITGEECVGSVCADNYGLILNCKASGEVEGNENIGGLCGMNDITGTISNVFSAVHITGNRGKAGGVCGYNSGVITNCSRGNEIIMWGDSGGICGYNNGSISKCSSESRISTYCNAGGICGYNDGDGVIMYCLSTGSVEQLDDGSSGGICGLLKSGSILYSYSQATISSDNQFTGGICGSRQSGKIFCCYAAGEMPRVVNGICGGYENTDSLQCFWDAEKDGSPYTEPGNTEYGAIGKTTAEMQDIATFADAGWDFANLTDGAGTWYMPEGSYPVFAFVNTEIDGTAVIPNVTGMDISNCCDTLVEAGLTIGRIYYVNSLTVESGITVSLSVHIGGVIKTDIPIDIYISKGVSGDGTESSPWPIACRADLEAVNNDLTASYVMVNDIHMPADKFYLESVIGNDLEFTGKFDGYGHKIDNLKIYGSGYTGLFECFGPSATVSNLCVDNCNISGYITGGICANKLYGSITNSCVKGVLFGYTVGGICGVNSSGDYIKSVIQDCYVFARIGGGLYIGGICGKNYSGRIKNCYSNCSPFDNTEVYNPVAICWKSTGNVTNCFWNVDIDGSEHSNSGYNYDGAIGKISAELKSLPTFTDAGWDFAGEDSDGRMDVWYLPEGDYPRLFWEGVRGDCDYDGLVDGGDLGVMGQWWMSCQDDLGADERLLCDFDFDGVVGLGDFAVLAGNWLND